MFIILQTGEKVRERPHGVSCLAENPCIDCGHELTEFICPTCGRDYCCNCGLGTTKTICPTCGRDRNPAGCK